MKAFLFPSVEAAARIHQSEDEEEKQIEETEEEHKKKKKKDKVGFRDRKVKACMSFS